MIKNVITVSYKNVKKVYRGTWTRQLQFLDCCDNQHLFYSRHQRLCRLLNSERPCNFQDQGKKSTTQLRFFLSNGFGPKTLSDFDILIPWLETEFYTDNPNSFIRFNSYIKKNRMKSVTTISILWALDKTNFEPNWADSSNIKQEAKLHR